MIFKLEIDTGNDAFADGNRDRELARIVHRCAAKLEDGMLAGSLRDINGNEVGTYWYEDES